LHHSSTTGRAKIPSHYHVKSEGIEVNKFWEENMKKRGRLVGISVDEILIKRTLMTYDGKKWTGFSRPTTAARDMFF
jgi:hypothetical protein